METGAKTNEPVVALGLMEPLTAAMNDLVERDFDWREPAELTQVLDAGCRLRSQSDAVVAFAVVAAERAGVHKQQRHDYRNVIQMVADRTGADPGEVRRLGRYGKWITEFDELADAWKHGNLLTEHVELIRRVASNGRTNIALLRDQHLFIEWAADYDFVDYGHSVAYWMVANDPDGAKPKEQAAKTYFRAKKRVDGTVKLDGLLDPLAGAAFMTAFETETQKIFRNDSADIKKSVGQRGAQALMRLMIRGSIRADGTMKPLINIVMGSKVAEDLLERLTRSPLDNVTPLPVAFDDPDKRCELIDGTPIHPLLAAQVLDIADFQRHILDAKSRVLDSSVNARFFNEAQQQALRVEARGRCKKRGCDSPFPWLEADHKIPKSRGGPTSMANGQMYCKPDNQAKSDRLENPAA